MHDHVDHAVREQILGLLEALGQLLADGLLDDARSREADERAGLGDVHVAQHRIGRRHAAGGRIGEHHEIGQARLAQLLHGNRRARHLHEREDALLHARSAGGREQDERHALVDRAQHAGDNGFAGRHAERAGHEAEVLYGNDDFLPFEGALGHEHRVVEIGLGLGGLETLRIFAAVAEFQGVVRNLLHRHLDVFTAVEEGLQPLLRGHPHVVVGAGDDELVGLQILVIDHLPGVGAFDPHVLRHLALARRQEAADFRTDEIVDPVHRMLLAPLPDPRPERTWPSLTARYGRPKAHLPMV